MRKSAQNPNINTEKAKDLIKQAVQHLSEAVLTEENGWTDEDITMLEYIAETDFDITFKKEE